jgi:mono/diheme cytochrome c family protein
VKWLATPAANDIKESMSKFLFGFVIGIVLLLLAEYLFATRGGIFMGTKDGPLPMERLIASKAIDASIGKNAQDQSPVPADETNLLAGAHVYQQNCVGCHGKLDQPASAMSKKFYPHIPQLLPPGKGVTDDPVGVTHWVVTNGIRFSAMPSFEGTLTHDQLWQVSQFLRNADKLPPAVQDVLRQPPPQ